MILGQTAAASLLAAEQVLHHVEGVLDLRTDARLNLLGLLDRCPEWTVREEIALAQLHSDVPVPALGLVAICKAQ